MPGAVIVAYMLLANHDRAEKNVQLKHERSRGRLSGSASRGVKKGNRRGKARGGGIVVSCDRVISHYSRRLSIRREVI
jgi:hypothetical protein